MLTPLLSSMSENPVGVLIAGVTIIIVASVVRWRMDPLYHIPTLGGPSFPGLSYFGARNFLRNGKQIVDEGYRRFYNTAYKVAQMDQWIVIVSGPKMIEDLRKRLDDEMSFMEGVDEQNQLRRNVSPEIIDDPFHIEIVKAKLTRTIQSILPDVVDELRLAVDEHIPAKEDEWSTVNVMHAMQQIVARASNRVFIGLPLCRNQDLVDLQIAFTMAVNNDQNTINLFPRLLKPIAALMVNDSRANVARVSAYLEPVFEERKAMMAEYGDDWKDKPNDMLQWILDEAAQRPNVDASAVEKLLLVNFAAIHTSSLTMTHVLYDLAAHPEYLQDLHDEVTTIVNTDGWSKNALGKMWKLDSFIKESSRHSGINLTALTRKAMKDVTLADGTFIPKGTVVTAAVQATHHDENIYADAEAFDPFRFSRMRQEDGESTKHQFVNTSNEFVHFGHGKHACPGRFFAANELKAMLAYIVLNYEIKMGGDGKRPPNSYYGLIVYPPSDAPVLFRKRRMPEGT